MSIKKKILYIAPVPKDPNSLRLSSSTEIWNQPKKINVAFKYKKTLEEKTTRQ